jgi:Domian of unknown function (DUF4952)
MRALRLFFATYLVSSCLIVAHDAQSAGVARDPARKSAVCADFLAQLKKKPAHLIFDKCTSAPDRQGKPLRAAYHVSGMHAARVEAALVASFGLKKLKRSCCQWDSPPTSFKSARGEVFVVSMVSAESAVAKRAKWREILRFEVVVELLTEEI